MKLHAILITRNDDLIIEDWLERHHHMFDTIAVVDGSDGDFTRTACAPYPNIRYGTDPASPITDQTLRHHGFELLRGDITEGDWIFNAHPDEFLVHDPHSFMDLPWNLFLWLPLHILPHTSEMDAWHAMGGRRPIALFRHFWWRRGRLPHCELRMWRFVREPVWDLENPKPSSEVIPMNYLGEPLPNCMPIYLHFKCYDPRPEMYEADGRAKRSQLETGVPGRSAGEGFFFDEEHPYMEEGEVWNVARFTSVADLLTRFGNPPRVIHDDQGKPHMVNHLGQGVH
ncbi:glycosyltransferase family 2 protein [Azospirillum sp. B4]|uniref:glycosyltransferase family 2 protein n=1 Tax=Azospirillum sp. B4 TaxID=95605 RepID=UPI000346862E|nr:glycosyltransferase family 2 protein [Azospirillum sp. B4]